MYTVVYAKVRIKGNKRGEVMFNIGAKNDVHSPPHYLACILTNLKHI